MNGMTRKQQILQTLAEMLEEGAGKRITTARLAERVGVSEAALYRHFPSKARMFEGLIEFIEETLFTRIKRILDEDARAAKRCQAMLYLLLAFAERNPGLCRILVGDALASEADRLRHRVVQLFDRLEVQLRQIVRESGLLEEQETTVPPGVAANLMLAAAEGRIAQYARSGFKNLPTRDWDAQWNLLAAGIFGPQGVTEQTDSLGAS